MRYELKVNDDKNLRIDKYLSEELDFSRNFLQDLIDRGMVFVNDKTIRSSYKLKRDDLIVFNYSKEEIELEPKKMDLEILYEDASIGIINKPKGLIVHPTNLEEEETLVNGLLFHFETLGNMNSIRPGIVHRLDKDTSGLVVIAKTDESYNFLVSQFSQGEVERRYKALVHGRIETKLIVDKPIGRNEKERIKMAINYKNGKPAISKITPIELFENYTLIEVKLETGRTHQIRVHLSSIGHPVVGDLVYGVKNEFGISTQLLHAYHLEFTHPTTLQKISFESEIPEDFKDTLRRLR